MARETTPDIFRPDDNGSSDVHLRARTRTPQNHTMQSWTWLALISAFGSAATSLLLKRTIVPGNTLITTAAFRLVSGILLIGIVIALGAVHAPTAGYWRAVALMLPPEVGGVVFMSLALRSGDVSEVAPISGLLPVFTSIAGFLFLHESPTAMSAAGVLLVAAGVYCVGLHGANSALEPLRALGRSTSVRYAVASAVLWSLTTVVHKLGIAEVGPLMWGMTVALGSGLVLAIALPFSRERVKTPWHERRWTILSLVTALCFAGQQVGLQLALQKAQAGYVIALGSTSTLIASMFGMLLLGERRGPARIIGAILVTCGAALVALGG
jgi:uncharacterized membrane protein